MVGSFYSMIVEQRELAWVGENLVVFGAEPTVLELGDSLVEAADLVQARFLGCHFLVEVSMSSDASEMDAIDDAFEFAVDSDLWFVPFDERSRLPEPIGYFSDFKTYRQLFKMLAGPLEPTEVDEVDIEGVWARLYAEAGLMTFRLILSN